MTTQLQREQLERSLQQNEMERARLLRRQNILDAFGEDTFENETVLTWKRRYHGTRPDSPRELTYVALKVSGIWYVTGARSKTTYNWDMLVDEHLAAAATDSILVVGSWMNIDGSPIAGIDCAPDDEPGQELGGVVETVKVRVVDADPSDRSVTVTWPADWAMPLPSKTARGGITIGLA